MLLSPEDFIADESQSGHSHQLVRFAKPVRVAQPRARQPCETRSVPVCRLATRRRILRVGSRLAQCYEGPWFFVFLWLLRLGWPGVLVGEIELWADFGVQGCGSWVFDRWMGRLLIVRRRGLRLRLSLLNCDDHAREGRVLVLGQEECWGSSKGTLPCIMGAAQKLKFGKSGEAFVALLYSDLRPSPLSRLDILQIV